MSDFDFTEDFGAARHRASEVHDESDQKYLAQRWERQLASANAHERALESMVDWRVTQRNGLQAEVRRLVHQRARLTQSQDNMTGLISKLEKENNRLRGALRAVRAVNKPWANAIIDGYWPAVEVSS